MDSDSLLFGQRRNVIGHDSYEARARFTVRCLLKRLTGSNREDLPSRGTSLFEEDVINLSNDPPKSKLLRAEALARDNVVPRHFL